MLKGLFLNNKKAKDSIYESGYMAYQCVRLSKKIQLDYLEISEDDREIPSGYDFYFYNYHPVTMSWLSTKSLKQKTGFVITLVLEILPNDPFVLCPEHDFNAYCVLDPTINIKNKRVYPFPRPLEKIDFELPPIDQEGVPVIGSFGFATKGKGFHHVVEAVNKEFETAIVKINIPYGDFVPDSKAYAAFISDLCTSKAKPGIEVQVTNDFMSKEELIKWCAGNTLNCFLYDRDMPGLAATTDQAIVSERPLSVSNNPTFRHVLSYLPPYPEFSLKDSIQKSGERVLKMKQDWSPENFAVKFEELLFSRLDEMAALRKPEGRIQLDLYKKTLSSEIQKRIKRYKRKSKKIFFTLFTKHNDSKRTKEII